MTAALISLLLITLAATRATRLIVTDKITEPIRRWITDHNGPTGWITYLFFCPWCIGFWIAGAAAAVAWWATTLGTLLPLDWWFGYPALWLAIAYITGVLLTAVKAGE